MSSKHIRTLRERSEFLEKLIDENPDKTLGYEKAELSAIKWALEDIENEERNVYQNRAFINGQLVILKKYNSVLKKAINQGDESALEYLAEWSEDVTKSLKTKRINHNNIYIIIRI